MDNQTNVNEYILNFDVRTNIIITSNHLSLVTHTWNYFVVFNLDQFFINENELKLNFHVSDLEHKGPDHFQECTNCTPEECHRTLLLKHCGNKKSSLNKSKFF